MSKLRTPEDTSRFMLALSPIDQAFRVSENKWGVGRLERLQRTEILQAYKRGWDAYRVALEEGDGSVLETIGPKMIQSLAFMDQQATDAGHKPLDPSTWEASMPDGTVLVIVRTSAEASAVLRASRAADGLSYETTLPPDLGMTVRNQHEGRALSVWTVAEIAALISSQPSGANGWEGTSAYSGVQQPEGTTAEIVRQGYPLEAPLATITVPPPALDF